MRALPLAAAVLAAGSLIGLAPMEYAGPQTQTQARSTPAQTESKAGVQQLADERAMREQERAVEMARRRLGDLPTKHKNRASGERAHRTWHRRRSAGRAL